MTDPGPAEPIVEDRRHKWLPRPSLVWIVPLLALAISLGVAWRSYNDRGPTIEIVFDSASGITGGETTVRFRDFMVGLVEEIDFTDDLRSVVATVRLDKHMAPYIDESARFWLVQAAVGPRGITGLDTVLSGAYIDSSFDSEIGPRKERFVALSEPPLTPVGSPGLRIALRAPNGGSLAVGAPILFKQIAVGKIEDIEITEAGDVLITAFIDAPHQERLTTETRFWNASGISVEVGVTGASLRVDSLASLFEGGISFDTITSGGDPVESEHVYQLYASESDARSSILAQEDSIAPVTVSAVFQGTLRGLRLGADVDYRGIRVGEVSSIEARVVDTPTGPSVRLMTSMDILPNRLGIPPDGDPEAATLDLFEAAVARGMRARLQASGLLNPTLYVALAEDPDAAPAFFDRDAEPFPRIPSVLTDDENVVASATGIIDRIQALPIEDVVDSAITLLASVTSLINDDRVRAAPENLGLLIADLRKIVAESGIEEVPAEVTAVLASVRAIVEDAAEQQIAAELAGAIEEGRKALATVNTALPGMVESLEGTTARVEDLPLEDVVAAARQLIENVDTLVQTEVAPLPKEVSAAVDEIRLILVELREGGLAGNVNASLASLRQVADELVATELAATLDALAVEAEVAVKNISAASNDMPALVDSLTRLSEEAAALPLDRLVDQASALLGEIDTLLKSEAVAGVPVEVEASLREMRGILAEVRAGGAVDNMNATLASVRRVADDLADADLGQRIDTVTNDASLAAGNISAASENLPELIDQLTRLSERAADLPLEDLVASTTATLEGVEAFLASEGVASVPPRLAATLAELEAILAELRAGGAVANVNATLASADEAAGAVTAAAQDLPALVAQLSATAARADTALSSVGPGSEINRDTLLLLREVRETARAVNALVSAIERRPNSLLFGR